MKKTIALLAAAALAGGIHQAQAQNVVGTDEVLSTGDYTRINLSSGVSVERDSSGSFDVDARVGTHYLRFGGGTGNDTERHFTAWLTDGFVSGHQIVPGTYTASIEVSRGGGGVETRDTYDSLELHLITVDEEEIGERTVVQPYVEPQEPNEWNTVTVSYTVESDSPLVGQTLTWMIEATFPPTGNGSFGPLDNVVVTLEESGDWITDFDPVDAPFAFDFGTGAGQDDEASLLRSRSDDFTLQGDSLRFEPTSESFISSAALASVDNYQARQDFSLDAEMTLRQLTEEGDNRIGFAILGGPHDPPDEPFNAVFDEGFYGLVWSPAPEGGDSVLRIREGFNGEILAETPWEGHVPFGDLVTLVDEDFEDVSAAEAAWSTGGTPSDLWEIGAPGVGPDGANSGDNLAATDLDGYYEGNTEAWLRSPVIDLTGFPMATLSFYEFTDIDETVGDQGSLFHNLSVRILDAGTNSPVDPDNPELAQYNDVSDWRLREFQLPAEALDREIVIEFRIKTDSVIDDDFAGWYIDDVEVTGIAAAEPATLQLAADGVFDPGGALDLTFTLTDEDAFSQSVSTQIIEPFAGNLFGFGGRARTTENPIFDFHAFSMEVGDAPDPVIPSVLPPFDFAFGSGEGRDAGEDFLRNRPDDWALVEDALQLSTASADYHNSLATIRVTNFDPGNTVFLEADMTLDNLDAGTSNNRAGLVIFGAEDPEVYDPDDDSSFYTLQWLPNAAGGGSIAVRQGMNGTIVAETAFSELDSPPAAEPGNTYNFRFLAQPNGGNTDFTGVVSDGVGGAAVVSGSMPAPAADANRFGLGARHRGAENPVWDFHSLSWSETAPLPLPLRFQFGSAAGRDSDDDFAKTGYVPDAWNLGPQSLDYDRNPGSTVSGIADANATANALDATPGMPFAVRAQVTASGEDSHPLEFLPEGQGQGHIETGVTAGDLGIDGGNARTIEAWALARVFDNNGTVWTMGNTGSTRRDFTLKVAGNQNEWVLNHWGSGGNDIWFVVPDSAERWVHLAMVFTGTESVVYVDGEEVARENRSDLDTGNDNTFKIGWWHNRPTSPGLDGYVEEVRVWNVVRTEEEIRENRFRRLTGSEDGLTAYWPMNEGEGETVFDLGPNGFDGTFVTQEGTTPEWTETGGSRLGLTFLGETSGADSAYRFYWHPFANELTIDGPGDEGTLASMDLSGATGAPEYIEGDTYTLEMTGLYNTDGSLDLSGVLSDGNGGEAEITTQVANTEGLPEGDHFGITGRHRDLDWHSFEMGTPEQLNEEPGEETTFADWQEENFGNETDPDIIGATATPAGDGIANFLKYAFGLDPLAPAAGADLPQPEVEDGLLQMTYPERRNGDAVYLPEASTDLGAWNGENVDEINRTQMNADFDEVTVRATLPDGTARGFLRVNVQQQ